MPNYAMEKHQLYQAAWQLHQQSETANFKINACEGAHFCACPSVQVFCRTQAQQKIPTLYQPSLVFIFSGVKKGTLGAHQFQYDADHFLALTSTYPFQSQVEASVEQPLLGIQIDLERASIAQLLQDISQINGGVEPLQNSDTLGIESHPMTEELREQLFVLMRTLQDPVAAQLFGEERIRAVLYTVLQGSCYHLLRRWSDMDGLFAQFQKAVAYIQQNHQRLNDIQTLSQVSGMSASSLNRAFKKYAADTPLQYIKKIRLNTSRSLILNGLTAQSAAFEVGYESMSQFGREFKRYFGYTPKQVKKGLLTK